MIDVSSWQGRVDWRRVYASGVRRAAVKLTEGIGKVDPFAAANLAGARKAGVQVFVYHFAHPSNSVLEEAHAFLTAAESLRAVRPGDLPPHLDLELAEGLTAARLDAWAGAFCRAVEAHTGCRTGVYSSLSFLLDELPEATRGRPVWGADYRPRPWDPPGHWWAWQYSCTHTVPGIRGHVDASVVYEDRLPALVRSVV